MAISIGRLSGGNTPADGSDPRTFPAIWNATADTLEGLSNTVDGLEVGDLADVTVTSPSFGQPLTYDPVSEQWVNDSGNYPVMVFADSTARSSAIPSPTEGMVTYLEDENEVQVYDGSVFTAVGPGKILQVINETASTQVTNASTTFVSTNLSASITPTSATSKILVITSQVFGTPVANFNRASSRLLRDATVLVTNSEVVIVNSPSAGAVSNTHMFNFLDSPSTSSAVTYSTEFARDGGTGGSIVNKSGTTPAFITLMEVAG